MYPGPDFDSYATAAMAGVTENLAERLLERLAQAHLIQRSGLGHISCTICSALTLSSLSQRKAGDKRSAKR